VEELHHVKNVNVNQHVVSEQVVLVDYLNGVINIAALI